MLEVLPKVRLDVDAFPYKDVDGALGIDSSEGAVYILYDKSGMSEAQLMVSASSMYFITRMDGTKSLLALRDEFEKDSEDEVRIADIEDLVSDLDGAKFLDNHNFKDLYNNLLSEFTTNLLRESACSGSVYSSDVDVLRRELNEIIENAPKPEMEGRVGNVMRRAPRGVIAPHMDFARAGKCYGQVYSELLKHYNKPDVVVILGTAHNSMKNRFAVCDKDFELTGGVAKCHKEITQGILSATSSVADFKEDIFLHRSEHSIELQAVWLEHIWPGVRIVPILVGEMDEYIKNPAIINEDEQIASMISAITSIADDTRVTVIASADLSHIGRRFGDDRDLDVGFISETEVADRQYLNKVIKGDALGALGSLEAHGDKYHICGTGCIYMLGALLPDVKGQLLGYYQAVSDELEQAVGCAGIIFE